MNVHMTMHCYKLCLVILLLLLCHFKCIFVNSNRLYIHQFPQESEHLKMPQTVLFSIYMGEIKYPHMPLLLESMRWNPMIHFKVINIIPKDSNLADRMITLQQTMQVKNFEIITVSLEEWSSRVKNSLGIDVAFTMKWYYKMCDYKPIIAYLFPEHTGPEYKYWGFADMDVIWGNFTRFAGWFQGQPFVISGICVFLSLFTLILFYLSCLIFHQILDVNTHHMF